MEVALDIIQPLDLESAYRPFSVNGKHYLALSCKLFFPLQGGYPLTCTEAYGPAGQQITAFTDELLPKLSTEYAIAGEVQTPGLQPVRALQCRVRLADKEKRSEETRLNSSHVKISYAVFCLKKKKKRKRTKE